MKRALVTVPHTGTRYVVACARAAGEIAIDGARWNGRWSPGLDTSSHVLLYMHFYHGQTLPEPEYCVTLLRSPIEVLASHDQDRTDGRLPRVITTMLKRCFERQLSYIGRGAKAVWLSDGIEKIGEALGVPVVESPRDGSRDYPLKESLAAKKRGIWRVPLLDWWLLEMGHVDAAYARLGCDVWWR